jgi:hypothetical protein
MALKCVRGEFVNKGKLAYRHLIGIASACAVCVSLVQPSVAGPGDTAAVDPVVLKNWRTAVEQNTEPGEGCYKVTYPSYVWEKVACETAAPRAHPVLRKPTGDAQTTGNGDDYVAMSSGLITETVGSFPVASGITSEESVGVAAFGDGGILGSNEYSIQLNTNFNGTTAACKSHRDCTVWQQFIYATDYAVEGEGAVFIQYWLIDYGSSRCPSGWGSDGEGDCYRNSSIVTAPDISPTDLGSITVTATAAAGGNDTLVVTDGTTSYSLTAKDSVTDIATVWDESEFNVVGDAGGSLAEFNSGVSNTVNIALTDGSTSAPTCVADAGTTGETNNLDLGSCTASSGTSPSVQFTESN